VYCCHSRPDKIDPATFRAWLRALKRVNANYSSGNAKEAAAVLWLLRSGPLMERNLRSLAHREFGPGVESSLRFCDVSPRSEHLRRLGASDVFLDTPAYGAHTVGCDALWNGVPMISLLRPTAAAAAATAAAISTTSTTTSITTTTRREEEDAATTAAVPVPVNTDKLASRVGASLLRACGIGDEMIAPAMKDYEDLMVRCAADNEWYGGVREKLKRGRDGYDADGYDTGGDKGDGDGGSRGGGGGTAPLFDTERWVRNLERGLRRAVWMPSDDDDGANGGGVVAAGGRGASDDAVIRRDILILDD